MSQMSTQDQWYYLNNRTNLADGDKTWARVPYQVELGNEFTQLSDALRFMMDYDKDSQAIRFSGENGGTGGGDGDSLAKFVGLPEGGMMNKPYFRDTRVGANDAINCLYQFNRDDDLVHPLNRSTSPVNPQNAAADQGVGIGLGRVYAQTIELNQSIAWFTFGTARFAKLATFYAKAFDKNLIELNSTGMSDKVKLKGLIGDMIGNAVGLLISVPTLPVRWLWEWATKLQNLDVDRFYDLRCTMHLYYKYVDSILTTWLVNAGIYTGENGKDSWTADSQVVPLAIRETGMSIWDILKRKATMMNKTNYESAAQLNQNIEQEFIEIANMNTKSYDDSTDPKVTKWSGASADWSTLIWQSALGASQFVGFRIEKSTDASESFSNSTGTSSFAEKINSAIAAKRDAAFNFGDSNSGDAISNIVGAVEGALTSIAGVFKMDNLASAIMGGAFIDIPEQYKGSDFNKSHSLSFQLRAPYGTLDCIYQTIMIPLALIIAGALPHAAGPNSYMQPFLCRVYSKGLFSVPLGIIDSLTIKRGSSEFGWTYQNLPTCVDVTVSIKDLTPIMYIGLKDGLFQNLTQTNNSFDEYLLTLAGVGLWDRISKFENIKRRMTVAAHRIKHTIANPMYHSSWISETAPVQFIAQFSPSTRIPNQK